MAKTPLHIKPLSADLMPEKSSTALVNEHIQRLLDRGERQKTIALSLGFKPNYVSQLKDGVDLLPLPRIIAFAEAVRLTDEERSELKRPGFRGGSNTGEWSHEEVPEVFA